MVVRAAGVKQQQLHCTRHRGALCPNGIYMTLALSYRGHHATPCKIYGHLHCAYKGGSTKEFVRIVKRVKEHDPRTSPSSVGQIAEERDRWRTLTCRHALAQDEDTMATFVFVCLTRGVK